MSPSFLVPFSGSRRKWEGVEEVLQLGGGTQEEGQVHSRVALSRGHAALLSWARGEGHRLGTELLGVGGGGGVVASLGLYL